jgi:hypothetical protein
MMTTGPKGEKRVRRSQNRIVPSGPTSLSEAFGHLRAPEKFKPKHYRALQLCI